MTFDGCTCFSKKTNKIRGVITSLSEKKGLEHQILGGSLIGG